MDYSFDGAVQNSITVVKSRDLSSCTSQPQQLNPTLTVPYLFPGNHQSLPITKSTSQCRQTITSYRISAIECEERHVLRPFSSGTAGAVTGAKQSLVLLHETPLDSEPDRTIQSRSTLLYQNEPPVPVRDSGIDALASLQQLCQKTEVIKFSLFHELWYTFIVLKHNYLLLKRNAHCAPTLSGF